MGLTDDQRAILALWYVVNASLSSYYKLLTAFGSAKLALVAPSSSWQELGIHKSHLVRLLDKSSTDAFVFTTQERLQKGVFGILFAGEETYPKSLMALYDPPPVLFYQGNIDKLHQPQLAIVGTRNPTAYAQKITFDLAQYLVQAGFVITSGLALGVDSFAHKGALAQTDPKRFGATVGVLGTGIDVCYPKPNQGLFHQIVQAGGCLVSELLPGTPASKHTFPRRNRLVTGLSSATIITEATVQSGSLISARLCAEQGKQVFAVPANIDNPNAEGCHYLIREGATLIYHPNQIIEDLNQVLEVPLVFSKPPAKPQSPFVPLATSNSPSEIGTDKKDKPAKASPSVDIPEYLAKVYDSLDHSPKDLDKLVELTDMDIASLLSALVELEILGVVYQSGGCYAKA